MKAKVSLVLLSGMSLVLGACSSTPKLVVDGPNPPPAKPVVTSAMVVDDFIVAAGSNTILFETNSSQIDAIGRETLERQAAWLMTHPDVFVLIEGHADKRSTDTYNQRLGQRRAQAVVDFFVSKGLTRERFAERSFGKGKPVIDRSGDVVLNRRAVTVILDSPLRQIEGVSASR